MKRGTRKPSTPAVFKTATSKPNPPAANTAEPTPDANHEPRLIMVPLSSVDISPNQLSPIIKPTSTATDLAPHFAEPTDDHIRDITTTKQAEPAPEPPQAVADYRAVAGLVEPKTPPPVPVEQMSLIQLRGYIQRAGIAAAYPDLMDVYDLAKLRATVAELVGN